ncbi:MAG TPA: hypothetical protein VHS33_09505 [Sphingomicrobium sp.]|nr:hypothetical protein [Sphingomicrobium sp.]
MLFHGRYLIHAEVWRTASNDTRRVILAQLTTLLTAGGFTLLAHHVGSTHLLQSLKLAAMIWLIAPLPLLVANGLFIKIDWLVTASHAAGWLAKLLLCAAAVAYFL